METNSGNKFYITVGMLRERITNRLLPIFLAVIWITLAISLWRTSLIGFQYSTLLHIVLAVAISILFLVRKRIRPSTCAMVMLLILFLLFVADTATFGLLSSIFVLAPLISMYLMLLGHRKSAFASIAVNLIYISAIAFLYLYGILALPAEPNVYLRSPIAWILLIAPIVGISIALVAPFELLHGAMGLETHLKSISQEYQSLFSTTPDGLWFQDLEGRIVEVNDAYCRMSGYERDELLQMQASALTGAEPAGQAANHAERTIERTNHDQFESKHRRKDGSTFDASVTTVYLAGEGGKVACFIRDISGRKAREEQLRRLNRTLNALHHSAEAIANAKTEKELLDATCKIIVEDCGHAMVWIGYKEDDERKSVRPVAYSGFDKGYLETLKISWADTELGRGPTGTAVRTGKPSFCGNMSADPKFKPWREEALKRGYAASLVLPLLDAGKAFGALTMYFREPDPFEQDEVKLLSELADDLAHGIMAMKLRKAREKAEEALRRSESRFRLLSSIESRLLSSDDPQGIINEVCRESMAFLDCQTFFNFLINESVAKLQLNTYHGIPEEDARKIKWLDYGVAVCGRVALTGERIIVEDIQNTPDIRAYIEKGLGIKAFCCHPLKAKGKVLGTLSFGAKNRTHFADDEVEFMGTVADQVAIAMESIRTARGLKQAAERWQITFDAIPDMVSIQDKDFKLINVNKAYSKSFNKSVAELKGRRCFEIVHQTDCSPKNCPHIQTLRSGNIATEELYEATLGKYLEITTSPLLNDNGELLGTVHVAKDISKRKLAEEELKKYEKHLEELVDIQLEEIRKANSYNRGLLEASPDPMVTISANGKITDVNKATEVATGVPRDQLIDSDFSEYFTEPEEARKVYKLVFTQGFVSDYPLAIRHKTRKPINVLYNATVFRNEAGEVQGVFAAARDITKRKSAEDALKVSIERLHLLETRLENIREEERKSISREVHDELGRSLQLSEWIWCF